MAYIAKQPNGLYCRFSSVVDTVTSYNMTEEDYVEYCAEKARKEALETLKNDLVPFERIKKDFFPINHTIEEFNEILKEMGDENGLGEERIKEINKCFED